MSTEVISGVIDSITTQSVNTKNGVKPVYHAMVNNLDVNLGFATNYKQGEQVALHVEYKYGGYQLLSIPAPAGTPAATGVAPASTGGAPTGSAPAAAVQFPVEINSRSTSIVRQNSLKHAVEIVKSMKDNALLGGISTEATYLAKVIEVAYELTDFSTGQREAKAAAAQAVLDGND